MTFSRQRNMPAVVRQFGRFPFLEDMASDLGLLQNWPDLLAQEQQMGGIAIKSDDKNVYVNVDMPGLNSDQIDISFDSGVLFVRGEQKEEKNEKRGEEKIYRQSSRSYSYRIALPEQIDASKEPKASYNNGVLEITLPKALPSQKKQIKVQKG